MIRVSVTTNSPKGSDGEARDYSLSSGALEIGRGPDRDAPRCIVADPCVSRDQLRMAELPGSRVWIENLSHSNSVALSDGRILEIGGVMEVETPIRLSVGLTHIWLRPGEPAATQTNIAETKSPIAPPAPAMAPALEIEPAVAQAVEAASLVVAPAARDNDPQRTLELLAKSPDAQTLARWFETVISVQRSAAGSEAFYAETAHAVVDLVGLDRGLVLVRKNDDWEAVAMHVADDQGSFPGGRSYSRGILEEVYRCRRTVYQNVGEAALRESLMNIEVVVAAPVLDESQNVVGVVYGSRCRDIREGGLEIRPLEAQLVQVLAAAVGAGLARQQKQAEAVRSQIQFEQFFSPELARELARDAGLLEGREREVTILFSDLRNFSGISERLGPRETFRLMQDVMELQTAAIRRFDGVVVDYYGDGLLAMWNAPAAQADHAARACRAALAIVSELATLSATWRAVIGEDLAIGVGINTGAALVGNTGSRVKFKYGPMGPTVNLANRVESASKQLGVPVLITGATRAKLDKSFDTRRLCRCRLVGAAEAVDVFELTQQSSPEWNARRATFETALAQYEAGEWADACQTIYPLLADHRGHYDVPSLSLLSRAVECLKIPPKSFDPVVKFTQK
jgi:adenylate cyclase